MPATIHIMGEVHSMQGHVQSLSAGIEDRERTTASGTLLANVNPTFSWVRLAQRIPVRIAIDQVPQGMALIAGRTATIVLDEDATVVSEKNRVNQDRKSTRLNSSHSCATRMPSSA